jgi:hypothetical protein
VNVEVVENGERKNSFRSVHRSGEELGLRELDEILGGSNAAAIFHPILANPVDVDDSSVPASLHNRIVRTRVTMVAEMDNGTKVRKRGAPKISSIPALDGMERKLEV